ncbi:hypothetical protein LguiB_027880 [Lonicera macranthoides]
MSTNSTSSSKKRKAKQSQTQNPATKNSQSQDDHEESIEPIIIVPYIPAPIVIDILSRTPIKALFNCCLLCQNWATLTSTPEFSQLHLLRSPINCLIKPGVKRLQSKGLELVDLGCPFSPSNKLVFIPKINFPDVPIRLFNCCNGQCIILPNPPHFRKFQSHPCAFGFSHKTNQYKVVLSLHDPNSPNYQTDIYTLGEYSWRSVGNSSYHIRNDGFCTFLNGVLHWIPQGKEYGVKVSWKNDIVITCPIYGFDTYEPIMINGPEQDLKQLLISRLGSSELAGGALSSELCKSILENNPPDWNSCWSELWLSDTSLSELLISVS